MLTLKLQNNAALKKYKRVFQKLIYDLAGTSYIFQTLHEDSSLITIKKLGEVKRSEVIKIGGSGKNS